MRRLLQNGEEVRAFSDRTVSPSFVDDVITATMALLERRSPPGLYHCVNTGWTTWAGVARELARLLQIRNPAITEIPMAAASLLAPRPRFAALSNRKLLDEGIDMPTWQHALARYVGVRPGSDQG
jgi:dTDP-4-dehydrorhamnose reductase